MRIHSETGLEGVGKYREESCQKGAETNQQPNDEKVG